MLNRYILKEAIDALIGKADKQKFTQADADPHELMIGMQVEKEHTPDPNIARKIALDHLAEYPRYYSALKKMEDKAKHGVHESVFKIIEEKAKSKAQQRFMGMVYAVKKHDMPAPSKEIADAAKNISGVEAKKYASTKHTNLPEHVSKKK